MFPGHQTPKRRIAPRPIEHGPANCLPCLLSRCGMGRPCHVGEPPDGPDLPPAPPPDGPDLPPAPPPVDASQQQRLVYVRAKSKWNRRERARQRDRSCLSPGCGQEVAPVGSQGGRPRLYCSVRCRRDMELLVAWERRCGYRLDALTEEKAAQVPQTVKRLSVIRELIAVRERRLSSKGQATRV